MPDQSYIGLWYIDTFRLDSLNILEINDKITFKMSKYRMGVLSGIATIENNRIKFIAYMGYMKVSGTMEIINNHIIFIITNSNAEYFYNGENYDFCVRDQSDVNNVFKGKYFLEGTETGYEFCGDKVKSIADGKTQSENNNYKIDGDKLTITLFGDGMLVESLTFTFSKDKKQFYRFDNEGPHTYIKQFD
jgi:hypothetical protein